MNAGEWVNDIGNFDLDEVEHDVILQQEGQQNATADTAITFPFLVVALHNQRVIPTDKGESRRLLQDLLGTSTAGDDDETSHDGQEQRTMMFASDYWREDMKWMLQILTVHPGLATEYFDFYHSSFVWNDEDDGNNDEELSVPVSSRAGPYLPLACCLLRVAEYSSDDNFAHDDNGLGTLQAIYELNPAALSQPQGRDNALPLHLACQYYECYHAAQLIHFWITQYPAALSHADSLGNLPIHHAIRNHSLPSSLLREMIELCPKSAHVSNQSGETPLRLAWVYSRHVELTLLIIQLYPEDADELDLRVDYNENNLTIIDVSRAQAIASLLPQVKRVQCSLLGWTLEAMRCFLHQLHNNHTVLRLHLYHVPRAMLLWWSQLCIDLKNVLLHNTTIQEFEFDLGFLPQPKQGSIPDDCDILLPLSRGIMGNSTLQAVTLKNLSFSDSRLLGAFLANGAAPKQVTLDHIQVFGDDWIRQSYGGCSVESLTLWRLVLSAPCLVALLHTIAQMPHLQQLVVDFAEDEGGPDGDENEGDKQCDRMITSALLAILSKQRLRSLNLHQKRLDIQPLCHAIKTNQTLQEFHFCKYRHDNQACLANVLEHNNTSLRAIRWDDALALKEGSPDMDEAKREDARVTYFSSLNHFGRGRARNPQLPIHDFIGLLCAVVTDDQSLLASNLQIHNMLHGLLREAPSVWSNMMH